MARRPVAAHDTGVFANTRSDRGYYAFLAHGLESKTYVAAVQSSGYLTSMMGKYLNGYEPSTLYQPAGWNDWNVAGNGYPEFNHGLDENGKLVHYGGPTNAGNYMTQVLAGKGTAFIAQAAAASKPFVMEVATFAPHAPYTPAPSDVKLFPGLTAPRVASFDKNNTNPPVWLGPRLPLTPKQIKLIDTGFRKRVQAVQAVDRLIAQLENTLAARGLAQNTYVVFSSDNGYHMGQHRLLPGKMTAFDTDIRVPLIVASPGVPQGKAVSRLAENIDLNPTFVQLAGDTPDLSVDGHSLVPLILGQPVAQWRTVALVEHHGPDNDVTDVDHESDKLSGNRVTYEAIRMAGGVYVEYVNGEHEYYNIVKDPEEMDNLYSPLSPADQARLHMIVAALSTCHGTANCWTAGLPH